MISLESMHCSMKMTISLHLLLNIIICTLMLCTLFLPDVNADQMLVKYDEYVIYIRSIVGREYKKLDMFPRYLGFASEEVICNVTSPFVQKMLLAYSLTILYLFIGISNIFCFA